MAHDVTEALDLLDLAVGQVADLVGDEVVRPYAESVAAVRRRIGFLGDSVVIALVGGTGSGKSSLLNSLAGEPVAPTGVKRPTTESPLAWIPANPEPGLTRLLDALGIVDRIGHDSFGELAVIDMPDTDSVVGSHRATVEALLPRVDAVAWVVDPEKYNDRLLHREFLEPLRAYAGQFVFVLNQVDRLSPSEEAEVVQDFRRVLRADGIDDPRILTTAAAPASGREVGVEAFRRELQARFEEKQAVMRKTLADLREIRDGLSELAGLDPGQSTSFDDRWEVVAQSATTELVDAVVQGRDEAIRSGRRAAAQAGGGPLAAVLGRWRRSRLARLAGSTGPEESVRVDGRGRLTGAASMLAEFAADLSFEIGGPFGRRLRSQADPESVEQRLGDVIDSAAIAVEPFAVGYKSRWWSLAAVVQWLLAAVFLAGVVWIWSDPAVLRAGVDPRPVSLLIGAPLVGWAVRMLVLDGGRRAGERAFSSYRATVAEHIRAGIDRRVGNPLRTLVRSRAELAGTLSQLAIATAALETDR